MAVDAARKRKVLQKRKDRKEKVRVADYSEDDGCSIDDINSDCCSAMRCLSCPLLSTTSL